MGVLLARWLDMVCGFVGVVRSVVRIRGTKESDFLLSQATVSLSRQTRKPTKIHSQAGKTPFLITSSFFFRYLQIFIFDADSF